MKPLPTALVLFAAGIAGAAAQTKPLPAYDPHAPVFVVTSRGTFQSLERKGGHAALRRASTGADLVLFETREGDLADIAAAVHQREHRCGGYYAFASRADAEAFLRDDRSAAAQSFVVAADYTIDNGATVNPWLPQVSEPEIRATIAKLSGYRNRYFASPEGKEAAEWIQATWRGLAGTRTDVTVDLDTRCANCSTQPSVIMTVQGSQLPDEVVVLGGHLDSITVNPNRTVNTSPTQTAPGADDDASGIATLTEVARVALASGWKPKRTVKFMAYAAEEVGLRGSTAISQAFKNAGTNVVGVLQLDMTNYQTASGVDMRFISDFTNPALNQFVAGLFDTYLAPLGLTRADYRCGYECSDHAPWTKAGYPSVFAAEGGSTTGDGFLPEVHSARDTLATVGNSAQTSTKFARLGLAFVGELAKTDDGTPAVNRPPAAGFSVATQGLSATFTDTSSDADGRIAARSWNFGDGGTSAVANPSHAYAAGGTYSVTLTVTDDDGATNARTVPVTVTASSVQTYENGTDYAIRDNATVDSPITVSGRTGNAPSNAAVTVAIVHPSVGQLKVDLVAPDGTLYNVHNRTGGSADDLRKTVTLDLTGESLDGTWKLRVNDNRVGSTGRIEQWSLRF